MKVGVNLRSVVVGGSGGMEVYLRNLLVHMLKIDKDIECLFFVTNANSENFCLSGMRIRQCLIGWGNYNEVIRKALKDENVDVYFSPVFALEPLIIGTPAVMCLPDIQHEYFPQFFPPHELEWRHNFIPPSIRIADAILTLSEFSRQTIIDKFKVNPGKVHAVHLCAEDVYENEPDRAVSEAIRRKYHLPNQFGVYPANTWPNKNHKNLILAINVYRKKYGEPPQIIFTGIQGWTHTRREIMNFIREYSLGTYVRHIGYVDKEDMPYIYNNAKFLVFPSLFEGFGMPILEAMCRGCPVVCSDCSSFPEIAGDAALYFDALNPEDIADKIHIILTDGELRGKLVERGKKQVQKFSWDATAQKTLEILKGVSKLTPFQRKGSYPLVSVVTPSLNQGKFIEETIRSVLSQDYPNIEYIIIDGGSSDNTVNILRRYSNRIKWISEPDHGQADAVNKGFQLAKGEILGWLNSDDIYEPGAVSQAVEHLLTTPATVMVYGDANLIDSNGAVIGQYYTEQFNLKRLSEICFVCQPTVFLRTKVLEKVGMLDTNLDTCMDFDYWIRVGKYFGGEKVSYLKGKFLANWRIHPATKTLRLREKAYLEIMQAVKRHFGYVPNTWIHGYVSDIMQKRREAYKDANSGMKILLGTHLARSLLGSSWGWIYLWQGLKYALKQLSTRRYWFLGKSFTRRLLIQGYNTIEITLRTKYPCLYRMGIGYALHRLKNVGSKVIK